MNRLAWFAMLAILPIAAQEKQKAPPPAKPTAVKPLLPPAKPSTPVENGDIDKRRDRMKQRDGEIDKILKEKQRKDAEAERNREKR
jgi:hypothetical protein